MKKLDSRYAFVLTGTPLENRIDEIYSIVQFLDPDLLGPLFRFNREFYELDDRGRPVGHRNLGELAERVSSVMLRRRKEEVESQLPGRTVKTFFVPMTDAQLEAYGGYEFLARRLGGGRREAAAHSRGVQAAPGPPRLYAHDLRYALHPGRKASRVPPRWRRIERLLPDLLDDPERKIIVFLRVGADAGAGPRLGGGRRHRIRLAHGQRPTTPAPCRDQAIPGGPRMPAVPLFRVRGCRAQPASGRYGRQHGPALEPRPLGAADRTCLAQASDPPGQRRQPRPARTPSSIACSGCWTRNAPSPKECSTGAATSRISPCRPAGPPSWSDCRPCSAPGRRWTRTSPAHHPYPLHLAGCATNSWASTARGCEGFWYARATRPH